MFIRQARGLGVVNGLARPPCWAFWPRNMSERLPASEVAECVRSDTTITASTSTEHRYDRLQLLMSHEAARADIEIVVWVSVCNTYCGVRGA